MQEREIKDFFERNNDEYLKFQRIPAERLLAKRPDLNGFLLLNLLSPGDRDMVCGASHDEIRLQPGLNELKEATEEQLVDLIRCGVRLDTETMSLCMFV